MKYLFVSLDGLIADIAWAVVKERHDVKFYINDPNEKEIADGFVPKTNNWEAEVDWADLVQVCRVLMGVDLRLGIDDETGATASVQPSTERDDSQHVLSRGYRRSLVRGGQRSFA
jgi:phosphoribosylamine---glycine ligase